MRLRPSDLRPSQGSPSPSGQNPNGSAGFQGSFRSPSFLPLETPFLTLLASRWAPASLTKCGTTHRQLLWLGITPLFLPLANSQFQGLQASVQTSPPSRDPSLAAPERLSCPLSVASLAPWTKPQRLCALFLISWLRFCVIRLPEAGCAEPCPGP